jgi:hypothetical protein
MFLIFMNGPLLRVPAEAKARSAVLGGLWRFSKLGIPFHSLAIQNPVRRGTAVDGVSRGRHCREQLLAREFLELFVRRHHVDNPSSVSGRAGYV